MRSGTRCASRSNDQASLHVLTMTDGCVRILIFYTRAPEWAGGVVREVIARSPSHDISSSVAEDPAWSEYWKHSP